MMKSSNLQKTLAKSEQYLPAEDTFFLADHLEGLSGDSALDIGCGSGYLTDILKSTFRLVVGTDISFNTLVEQNFKTQNVICCNYKLGHFNYPDQRKINYISCYKR